MFISPSIMSIFIVLVLVMVELNYGVPGSGKTFKAVHFLHSVFLDKKSANFQKFGHFYTNIADFNFDSFKGLGEPFKIVEIKKILGTLRLEYLKGVPESELVALASSLGFTNALFVIDEAQNFFSKSDDLLLWWIEYHRHFSQYIVLIAQSPKRILAGYKELGDLHFKAVPPSLRLGNSLSYKRYAESNLYKSSYVETLNLSPDKDIFSLYHSGANEKPKKIIYKFIAIAMFLSFVVFMIFYLFSSRFSNSDSNTSSPAALPSEASYPTVTSQNVFNVVCVDFDCSFLGSSASLSSINFAEKKANISPISVSSSNGISIRSYSNFDFLKGVFNVPLASSDND